MLRVQLRGICDIHGSPSGLWRNQDAVDGRQWVFFWKWLVITKRGSSRSQTKGIRNQGNSEGCKIFPSIVAATTSHYDRSSRFKVGSEGRPVNAAFPINLVDLTPRYLRHLQRIMQPHCSFWLIIASHRCELVRHMHSICTEQHQAMRWGSSSSLALANRYSAGWPREVRSELHSQD